MTNEEHSPDVNNYDSKEPENVTQKNNRRKLRGYKIVLIIIAVLALLSVVATAAGIIYVKKNFNYRYNEITDKPEDLGFQEVKDDNIVNIALFGIDTRKKDSFVGRSDSIMILSINTTDNKIKLISVLRDSLVPIDGEERSEFNKINAAYAMGGPELAIRTLNNIFNLDISEYATVNFYGMADIIDAMGGINVEVTENEVYLINGGVIEQCEYLGVDPEPYKISSSGTQHLNGIQAVSYSRIRYVANAQGTTNDYGRTDRQRYVLSQLLKKVSSRSKIEYINLIKAVSPCCETSLSYTEILSLAMDVLLDSPTFEESRVPFTDYTMKSPQTSAGSIVYYDLNFAANIIHAFIYEDIKPEDFIAANGVEKNDWYTGGYIKPVIISHEERQKQKQSNAASSEQSSQAQGGTLITK